MWTAKAGCACGVQQGQGGQDDAVPTGYQQDGPGSGRPLPSSAAEGACRVRSACLRTARRSCAQSPHLPAGSEPLRPPIVISKVVLAGPTPYLVQFLPPAVANPLPMPSLFARRPADGTVSCLRRPMGSEQSGGTRWRGACLGPVQPASFPSWPSVWTADPGGHYPADLQAISGRQSRLAGPRGMGRSLTVQARDAALPEAPAQLFSLREKGRPETQLVG